MNTSSQANPDSQNPKRKVYRIKENTLNDLVNQWAINNGYRDVSNVKLEGKFATFEAWHERDQVIKSATVEVTQRHFSVSDKVRLQGRTDKGRSIIRTYGQWWKAPPFMNKNKAVLTNLAKKVQGRFAGSSSGYFSIEFNREGDEHFKVIDVIPFPEELNLRTYKE